jgi:putative salt-induced outer membrane protein
MKTGWYVRAAVALILGSSSMAAHAQWTAKAEAGYVASRGNSDTESANAKLQIARELERWKHALELAGVYASDDVQATSQRWNARVQSDYKIGDRGFWFGSGRYEEDRFSGFEYQTTYGTGLGWRFIDTDRTKLSGQVGAGYRISRTRISLADDGVTIIPSTREEELIGQLGANFEHALTDTTKVLNKLLVESGSDNTFVQNDLSLQVQIIGALSLAVGYSVRYNSDPPAEFTSTDTLTTLNLVYELK